MSALYHAPFLMYHSIETGVPGSSHGKLIVPRAQFEKQMAYLTRKKRLTLTIDQFINLKEKKQLHGKPVILTFDDGFETAFHYAYDTLKRFSLKATFFIVTNFVGRSGYMSWNQVRELSDVGMEIGSHTLTHRWLPDLTEQEAKKEITESKKILEDKTGKPVKSFCYPLGGFNEKIVEWVKEAGYDAACVTHTSHSFSPDYPWTLKRVKVSPVRFWWLAFLIKSSGYQHLIRA